MIFSNFSYDEEQKTTRQVTKLERQVSRHHCKHSGSVHVNYKRGCITTTTTTPELLYIKSVHFTPPLSSLSLSLPSSHPLSSLPPPPPPPPSPSPLPHIYARPSHAVQSRHFLHVVTSNPFSISRPGFRIKDTAPRVLHFTGVANTVISKNGSYYLTTITVCARS